MKLALILIVAVVGASSQSCTPFLDRNLQTIPCSGRINATSVVGDKENCDDLPNCCMHDDECVVAAPTTETKKDESSLSDAEIEKLLNDAQKKARESIDPSDHLRSLMTGFLPPGLVKTCLPPVPFPGNCKPTRNEPYVLEPPINIPYCLRIPCNHLNNKMYEKSQRACGMQPGCYFDKELSEYREAFGDSVLPGVPVCHLTIRNIFFQVKAREVVRKYRSWNPYFTNCLLNEFKDEIAMGPKGCELLPILDAFSVAPKLAGWSNINSYECALIDGCWTKGRGCFYPVDINSVRIKSGQRPIVFKRKEIIYGRPKCQHFDVSSPLNILKSYHRCLSAGCSVDSSVTNIYFSLLYSVGLKLTAEQHWEYWSGVEGGLLGAFNLNQMIGQYGNPTKPARIVKRSSGPFAFRGHPACTCPPCNCPEPHAQAHAPRISVPAIPQSPPKKPAKCSHPLGGYTPPNKLDPCGFAFKSYGARPCAPPVFDLPHSNCYCPYKPFFVPRFPTLKGRFDGCCDINLCYLPKSEISRMHSGPSHYYSEWSLFSECSAPCGGGIQKRFRKCISDDQYLCTETLKETKPCNTQKCCEWSDWGHWTPCSKTCGIGEIRTRIRRCLPSDCPYCFGGNEEIKYCNSHPCHNDIFGW